MKLSPPRHRLFAAVIGLSLVAAPSAWAFTFEDAAGSSGGAASRSVDLTTPAPRFGMADPNNSSSGPTIRQGNSTLQFGTSQGSFNQRYDSNQMFDLNRQLGR